MALKIDVLVPGLTTTYEIGIGNVSNIQVKYYFANVVDIVISFTNLSRIRYYQVPCIIYTPPPI